MPPPITSIVFGRQRSSSAPVESTTRGSSGRNGSRTGWLPAAMIALSKRTTCFSPLRSWPSPRVISTSRWCGSRKRAEPRTTWTLRRLGHAGEPAGHARRPPSPSSRAACRGRSRGSPKRDAVGGERPRLVDDRGRMQQRLRRDAADVQADAAERRIALDDHRAACRGRPHGTPPNSRRVRRRAPASRSRRPRRPAAGTGRRGACAAAPGCAARGAGAAPAGAAPAGACGPVRRCRRRRRLPAGSPARRRSPRGSKSAITLPWRPCRRP